MTTTATRVAATASLGLMGVALLSGCTAAVDASESVDASQAPAAQESAPVSESAESVESEGDGVATVYTDGTYTATGQYKTPRGFEHVEITIDIEGDIITGVQFVGDPQAPESKNFQGQFADGIAAEVVGKPVDEVQVHRIAGSSLTSGGFNQALEKIKQEAAAA